MADYPENCPKKLTGPVTTACPGLHYSIVPYRTCGECPAREQHQLSIIPTVTLRRQVARPQDQNKI